MRAPLYFGPIQRPIFGMLHRPAGTWSGARILLCPPLGYEGSFAHLTFSRLAETLAEQTGAVVLTFDYDGTGDSASSDEDPGRVPAWLESIDLAIDHLKSLAAEPGPLVVIGLRAGALLAAQVVARRDDVSAFALWAPCLSGTAFLRELKAFAQLTPTNPPAPAGLERSWGERGFEANGFVFTHETVEALGELSLKALAKAPAPKVLLLHRAEMPTPWKPTWPELEQQTVAGYDAMMLPPWLWVSPVDAIRALTSWVGGVTTPRAELPVPAVGGRTTAEIAPDIEEVPIWYAPRRFGILTRQKSGPGGGRAMLLVAGTTGYRTASHRSNVMLARRLAARGVTTLRIDVEGVGDSRDAIDALPPNPYDTVPVADVRAALHYLRDEHYSSLAMSGICAGAFLAYRTAIVHEDPVKLVLVNIEEFESINYTVNYGAKSKEVTTKAQRAVRKLRRGVEVFTQLARASLPVRVNPSGLPSRFHAMIRRGTRVVMIFNGGDSGIAGYKRRMALHHVYTARKKHVEIRVIDGPDHSFTPRWAVELLIKGVVDAST